MFTDISASASSGFSALRLTVTPSYSPMESRAASSDPSGSSAGSGPSLPPQAASNNEAAKAARNNLRIKVESSRERVLMPPLLSRDSQLSMGAMGLPVNH